MPRPKVLFIGGAGRSGSTLLLRALGELDGYVAAGDLTQVWQRGFVEDQLCGCGHPFSQCPMWSRVRREALPEIDRTAAQHLQATKRRVCATARVPQVLDPRLRSTRFGDDLDTYTRMLRRLYHGIADAGAARVVVDGSKNPGDAAVLLQADSIDVSIVHLVRDSRGVVASWQRTKARPEIHWADATMSRYSWLTTSTAWNVYNGVFEAYRASYGNVLRVRYEDFVANPRAVLRWIVDFVGVPAAVDALRMTDGGLHLSASHTVSGNPMRFETGDVPIREDVGWHDELSRRTKSLVTALTYPMLRHYHYRTRS